MATEPMLAALDVTRVPRRQGLGDCVNELTPILLTPEMSSFKCTFGYLCWFIFVETELHRSLRK
jgi:hypothetical protein